jgi:hypothetical protein
VDHFLEGQPLTVPSAQSAAASAVTATASWL